MRLRHLIMILIVATFFSCRKETTPVTNPPIQDSQVFLKDIVVSRLPSPYYHFEYDLTGKISLVSYASGLISYNVLYTNNRITEMRRNGLGNNERLQYLYNFDGLVNVVKYIDSAGLTYERVVLDYEAQKPVNLERQKKMGNQFVSDKIMTFSYYDDGNLKDVFTHYLPIPGQTESSYTLLFENYDNKTNVDGFSLLHSEFFDRLIFLPGVQLQKNNPGKQTLTGTGEDYIVDYTYTYSNKNLPLTQSGNLLFLTGPETGRRFQLSSVYSYY